MKILSLKLSNLPKVTKLVNSTAKIWTQIHYTPKGLSS